MYKKAEHNTHDPDDMLGIRRDLRHHKVYTIDSPSTRDIDDGLSVERIARTIRRSNDNDETIDEQESSYRYWIHIADVDRWAPRGSDLLRVAERRGTSLYLPGRTLGMFPDK